MGGGGGGKGGMSMLTDSTFFFQGFPKCFLGARDNIMVASECLVCGRKCFFVAKYNFIAKCC